MALCSMTGYGLGKATLHGIRVVVEIHTVNRRQLDIQVHAPRSLAALDPRINDMIEAEVKRGRVSGQITVEHLAAPASAGLVIDEQRAEQYVTTLRATAARLGLQDDLKASQLLTLPDVVRFDAQQPDGDLVWPAMERSLRQALRALSKMRRNEGAALQADLSARMDAIDTLLAKINKRAPKVTENYHKSLQAKLRQNGISIDDNEGRLLRELVLFADRSDINEEVTRLDSHLRQMRKMLRSTKTTGKTLDFLAQEMFREINTIGSKANDGAISQGVVECKTELERIREQVQNVE